MKTKRKRHLAALICVLFLVVTFASLFYIVKEENHKCTGEDCPICACVHQAEQNLKNLGTGLTADFSTILVVLSAILVICGHSENLCFTSLVSQKVRLNN